VTNALNTLYVQTQGTYLQLESDTVLIETDGNKRRIPLHHLQAIMVFGQVMVSPFLLARCAEDGRDFVWLSRSGRFQGRLTGPVSGNVLLRRAQHATLDDPERSLEIARRFIAGKLQNARNTLQRAKRETEDTDDRDALEHAALDHAHSIRALPNAQTLDEVRGIEGNAASAYFGAFTAMIRAHRPAFAITERNKRPPRDPVNALLGFLYAILANDCAAALESVGLDPQVGFLHALRPGRSSLALDLMEEFRPVIADRVTLTLINRQQLKPTDFTERPGGAIHLGEDARKTVLIEYQKRKQEEITHPETGSNIPLGLVPHVQARLLARHIRGDLNAYPPFILR
jgi:CRISPR-associated protein Cas1